MKVKNRQAAWIEVNKLVPSDYSKDYAASDIAGYSVYRSNVEHYDYICDLGNRLEVNLATGKTVNIWIESPENAKQYATCQSETITYRTYDNGNSKDTTRKSTADEKRILYSCIYGALLSIKNGGDKRTAMNTAEFIALVTLPGINCYDSVYNKIRFCPYIEEQ